MPFPARRVATRTSVASSPAALMAGIGDIIEQPTIEKVDVLAAKPP